MAWQRVNLVVRGVDAEALSDALEAEGALSTELSDADAGTAGESGIFGEPGAQAALWERCRLTALFMPDADVSAILERSAFPTLGASIDRLEDADWVALTQRQFEPIQAGARLWIVPTWHEPPRPGDVNIVLDPGAAFGTGSHATTRMCLAWLEANVREADTVLDYGCGSGILGIAALKLGASRAMGVDVDPLALEAARYNSQRNAVALEVQDAQASVAGAFRITIANILANPLRMLAPVIASHTLPLGRIALAGILEDQARDVAMAYEPWATLRVVARDGPWVLMAGTRC
ncbi:MAG TPA: 50S ribosomal protein L11 methyltransferase [Usitatibacter sp.]|nr:50S ribosomal protein L11 methyltransferase [Usitatibacter sp.]